MATELTAPLAIHLSAIVPAIVIGAVQLARTKGTASHRLTGRIWAVLMLVAAISSFWIRRDGFSWIHGLSAFTIFSVCAGVYCARRGRRRAHLGWMTGAFLGSVGAGVGAVAGPGRMLHVLMFPA